MNPMLAAKADLTKLKFPVLASPKLDGVRAIIRGGQVLSRSLKPIPNLHVQRMFGLEELEGLDGELIVGRSTDLDVFNRTQSSVMARTGEPLVTFHVFDDQSVYKMAFADRLKHVHTKLTGAPRHQHLLLQVRHKLMRDLAEVMLFEQTCVEQGYEGIMLNDPSGLYKFGRSTTTEGLLLKLKRFEDSEATVLRCVELRRNTNEAFKDATGHQVRSTHKAGLVGAGVLGALVVRDLKTKVEFEVGSGFNAVQRRELWERRSRLTGAVITYKHQPHGAVDKPRLPIFKGFRDGRDL